MNRILGNAVFLWPVNPVRLLVYEGAANPTAIAGADTAIAQVANATGRHAVRTNAAAGDVPALLAATDVFLIYGQELANDTTLNQLGSDWAASLLAFMSGGGTVVLLDAGYTGNSGTCQILAQPGLFQLTRAAATTSDVCTVVARGDALTTGLPRTYLCEQNSTSFNVTDLSKNITVVVQDVDKTVVVHKLF
jgi:acyl-CoA synthetase (AMP-forming)/AMP-acid ligase II